MARLSYGQGFACSLSPPGVTCLADTLGRILGERLSSSWGSVTTVFGLGLSEIQRPPVGKGRGGRTTPILSDNVDLTTSSRSHRPPTGVNRRQHDALSLGVLHSCHSTAVAVKLRHRSHSRRSRCGYSERASRECASTRRSSGLGLNSSSRQVPRHSNTLRYSTTSTPGRRSRGCRDSAQPRWSRGPAAAISRNGELEPEVQEDTRPAEQATTACALAARSRQTRGRTEGQPRAPA